MTEIDGMERQWKNWGSDVGPLYVQEEFLGEKFIWVKSMCKKSFWVKSLWVKSLCKKSFWVKSLWVKRCEQYIIGEKYVQEEFLGEESLGEKYMGEK